MVVVPILPHAEFGKMIIGKTHPTLQDFNEHGIEH